MWCLQQDGWCRPESQEVSRPASLVTHRNKHQETLALTSWMARTIWDSLPSTYDYDMWVPTLTLVNVCTHDFKRTCQEMALQVGVLRESRKQKIWEENIKTELHWTEMGVRESCHCWEARCLTHEWQLSGPYTWGLEDCLLETHRKKNVKQKYSW